MGKYPEDQKPYLPLLSSRSPLPPNLSRIVSKALSPPTVSPVNNNGRSRNTLVNPLKMRSPQPLERLPVAASHDVFGGVQFSTIPSRSNLNPRLNEPS